MAQEEKVLLGVLDEPVSSSYSSFTTNKIGGYADWQSESLISKCAMCNSLQSLVCQIYCSLDNSDQHRNLYLFGCHNKSCWNKPESWSVFRCQRKDTSFIMPAVKEKGAKKESSMCVDEWGAGASDWGDGHRHDGWGTSAADWDNDTGDSEVSRETDNSVSKETECDASNGQENKCSKQSHSPSADDFKEGTNVNNDAHQQIQSDTSDISEATAVVGDDDDDDDSLEYGEVVSETIGLAEAQNAFIVSYLNLENSSSDQQGHTGKDMETSNKLTANTPAVLKSYYIDVFEEPCSDQHSSFAHEEALLREYARSNRIDFDLSQESSGTNEAYEKSSHKDKTCHHFLKRVSRCPQQILRYQYDGSVLPISKGLSSSVPRCERCGSVRVFEMQLMPSLVNFLQVQGSQDTAIEFGTVVVYTCKASCSSLEPMKEYVFVQPDPDQHLFKS